MLRHSPPRRNEQKLVALMKLEKRCCHKPFISCTYKIPVACRPVGPRVALPLFYLWFLLSRHIIRTKQYHNIGNIMKFDESRYYNILRQS
jgi:hypothetical protein